MINLTKMDELMDTIDKTMKEIRAELRRKPTSEEFIQAGQDALKQDPLWEKEEDE